MQKLILSNVLQTSLLNYMLYVLSCPTCLARYVLSCLTYLVPYVLSCLMCLVPHVHCALRVLVPHVLLCLTCPSCLVPCVFHVSISPFLLLFSHTSSDFFLFISNSLAFLRNLRQFK